MNSVTGESGPISIDRPRPAVSHEVPDCVERPGPVTPPVGLEGARAPCGGVAFANGRTPRRPHVMHVLDDEPFFFKRYFFLSFKYWLYISILAHKIIIKKHLS